MGPLWVHRGPQVVHKVWLWVLRGHLLWFHPTYATHINL